MIHYHGTPVSGRDDSAGRFYLGRHCLVSFANPDHIDIVAEFSSSFALDNGAYSFWRADGRSPDKWEASYLNFVAQWCRHPAFDFAFIPDSIGGSEAENDGMLSRWPEDIEGVPVWHYHESLTRLSRLCSDYRRVALGSSGHWPTPGTPGWWDRTRDAMRACCDSSNRPKTKLHGLRMLDPGIFTKLPLSSADSANAARNAGRVWNTYCPPLAWQRAEVIAARIEAYQSPSVWGGIDANQMFQFMTI